MSGNSLLHILSFSVKDDLVSQEVRKQTKQVLEIKSVNPDHALQEFCPLFPVQAIKKKKKIHRMWVAINDETLPNKF